jgi:sugar porter (SP) family MFS transporter
MKKRQSITKLGQHIRSRELSWETKLFAIKAGFVASIGGLHVGYDIGATAAVLVDLEQQFGLSTFQKEMVPSVMVVGAIVGSAVGGLIMDTIGRRDTIILTGVIFTLASAVCASAPTFTQLLFGRFVLGIGVAIALIADSAYLLEVSPAEWRGALVSCNEFMVAVGIMLAFTSGAVLSNWRVILAIPIAIAILQIVSMLTMPRSPRWLMQNGRYDEARAALAQVFPDKDEQQQAVDTIVAEMKGVGSDTWAAGEGGAEAEGQSEGQSLFSDLMPELVVCVTVIVLSQLTGNPLVMSYAPQIFSDAGLGEHGAATATVGLGAVKIVSTAIAIAQLDDAGRRPLLLFGATGCLVSMSCLAIAFSSPDHTITQLAIFGCVLYVAAWSISYGSIGLLLTSEMFPTKFRGQSMAVATNIGWIANLLVSSTFLSMSDALGRCATFSIYACVCAFGLGFIYLAMPETKGKEVLAIHMELHANPSCACCKSKWSVPAVNTAEC